MKIGSYNEYIELEVLEKVPEGTPGSSDVNLLVKLTLQDFSGSYSGVWLEAEEIKSFLSQLNQLEQTREGSAKITSMSPKEFILEIRSTDKLGHMEIEVQLHRHQYSGTKNYPVYLMGGFEAQPETISHLISCFKSI